MNQSNWFEKNLPLWVKELKEEIKKIKAKIEVSGHHHHDFPLINEDMDCETVTHELKEVE